MGARRVMRLRRQLGMRSMAHSPGKYSTKPGPPAGDDLLAYTDNRGLTGHNFVSAASGPNQVWVSDITGHPT